MTVKTIIFLALSTFLLPINKLSLRINLLLVPAKMRFRKDNFEKNNFFIVLPYCEIIFFLRAEMILD